MIHDIRLIAHRGLLHGPDTTKENHPSWVEASLRSGYDCEIDLWVIDGVYYLGHDNPQYQVNEAFLQTWCEKLFVHCKNLDCLSQLTPRFNYFWHEYDTFTLTSKGDIWAYYKTPRAFVGTIVVLPEVCNTTLVRGIAGICTDFPNLYAEKYQELV